ncbi:MAG: hypothetical protein ACQESR_17665 [Planctomycetota bacterium]
MHRPNRDQEGSQEEILSRLMGREEPARPARAKTRWGAVLVLVAAAAWILYITLYPVSSLSVWELQDRSRLTSWLGEVAMRYGLHAFVLVMLGGVLSSLFAARRPEQPEQAQGAETPDDVNSHDPNWPLSLLGHAVIGLAFLAVLALLAIWLVGTLTFTWGLQMATELGVGIPALLLGGWIGVWWRRTRRGLLKQVAIATFCTLGLALWLHGRLLQSEPLPFDPVPVSLTDKRDLLDLVKHERTTGDGHRIYRLSQHDLNKLAAWWLSVESVDGKAKMVFDTDPLDQQLLASIRYPFRSPSESFLNIRARGHCEVLDQQLDLSLKSLRIGNVQVPGTVSRWLSRLATRWISSDRDNMDLFTGVVSATVDGTDLQVILSEDGIRARRIAKLLRQMGDHPDVTPAVRAHLSEFARVSRAAGDQEPLFARLVRGAFQRAFENRAQPGRGAAEANRAAILALGIALGHVNLERAVGDCWVDDARFHVYRLPRHSTLRGRPDWARHFWVSAAMTLIMGNHVSDAAGLLKEELDSLEGGSGFSFGDLMADQAGTEFARLATKDDRSARAIQAWILDETHDLNHLMPPAQDLPEGLSETELKQQLGGVNGKPYQNLIEKMDDRLQRAPWSVAVRRGR